MGTEAPHIPTPRRAHVTFTSSAPAAGRMSAPGAWDRVVLAWMRVKGHFKPQKGKALSMRLFELKTSVSNQMRALKKLDDEGKLSVGDREELSALREYYTAWNQSPLQQPNTQDYNWNMLVLMRMQTKLAVLEARNDWFASALEFVQTHPPKETEMMGVAPTIELKEAETRLQTAYREYNAVKLDLRILINKDREVYGSGSDLGSVDASSDIASEYAEFCEILMRGDDPHLTGEKANTYVRRVLEGFDVWPNNVEDIAQGGAQYEVLRDQLNNLRVRIEAKIAERETNMDPLYQSNLLIRTINHFHALRDEMRQLVHNNPDTLRNYPDFLRIGEKEAGNVKSILRGGDAEEIKSLRKALEELSRTLEKDRKDMYIKLGQA